MQKKSYQVMIFDGDNYSDETKVIEKGLKEGVVNFSSIDKEKLECFHMPTIIRSCVGCDCTHFFYPYCDDPTHMAMAEIFYFQLHHSVYDHQLKCILFPTDDFMEQEFEHYWVAKYNSYLSFGLFCEYILKHIGLFHTNVMWCSGESITAALIKYYSRMTYFIDYVMADMLENPAKFTIPKMRIVKPEDKFVQGCKREVVQHAIFCDQTDHNVPSMFEMHYDQDPITLYSNWSDVEGIESLVHSAYESLKYETIDVIPQFVEVENTEGESMNIDVGIIREMGEIYKIEVQKDFVDTYYVPREFTEGSQILDIEIDDGCEKFAMFKDLVCVYGKDKVCYVYDWYYRMITGGMKSKISYRQLCCECDDNGVYQFSDDLYYKCVCYSRYIRKDVYFYNTISFFCRSIKLGFDDQTVPVSTFVASNVDFYVAIKMLMMFGQVSGTYLSFCYNYHELDISSYGTGLYEFRQLLFAAMCWKWVVVRHDPFMFKDVVDHYPCVSSNILVVMLQILVNEKFINKLPDFSFSPINRDKAFLFFSFQTHIGLLGTLDFSFRENYYQRIVDRSYLGVVNNAYILNDKFNYSKIFVSKDDYLRFIVGNKHVIEVIKLFSNSKLVLNICFNVVKAYQMFEWWGYYDLAKAIFSQISCPDIYDTSAAGFLLLLGSKPMVLV